MVFAMMSVHAHTVIVCLHAAGNVCVVLLTSVLHAVPAAVGVLLAVKTAAWQVDCGSDMHACWHALCGLTLPPLEAWSANHTHEALI